MSAAQPLLSAAVRQLSRSSYGVVAAPARGFQVFRIDGYSWTKTLPAGERISSGQFVVGGRGWHIATTPTARTAPGTPTPTPSPSSSGSPPPTRRSACGRSTSSACSTPPATPRTSSPLRRASSPPPGRRHYGHHSESDSDDETEDGVGVGLPDFVTKELDRRRETLLRDDCLAIRCDVGVTELGVLAVAPKESNNARRQDDGGGGESCRRHGVHPQEPRQKPPRVVYPAAGESLAAGK
ncbi:uncharacterized protein LOC112896864 [Panicum hallii]|uniref:uncharacterized protein LOC112896864 n=1 Tax=Panicum hallii TaxID=206008 RepID=UPI000DF4DC90|nr:uncharacterized protein LOC112896864 [Panicum hallii]